MSRALISAFCGSFPNFLAFRFLLSSPILPIPNASVLSKRIGLGAGMEKKIRKMDGC